MGRANSAQKQPRNQSFGLFSKSNIYFFYFDGINVLNSKTLKMISRKLKKLYLGTYGPF
jgi:hypothetical protein